MSATDRDQDGVPDAEQLTIEEIEAVDRGFGESVIGLLADPARRASEGRQADTGFDPGEFEYVATPRPVVVRSKKTGLRYQLNYNRLVEFGVVEFRTGHSIEGGVMGARASALTTAALSRLGSFGAFAAAVLAAGGSVPALLVNASVELVRKVVKGKDGNALIDRILGRKAGGR